MAPVGPTLLREIPCSLKQQVPVRRLISSSGFERLPGVRVAILEDHRHLAQGAASSAAPTGAGGLSPLPRVAKSM